MLRNCTFEGCPKTTENPTGGWRHFIGWGPEARDGLYCRSHADALEAALLDDLIDEEPIATQMFALRGVRD
jgi:hypothetical protein